MHLIRLVGINKMPKILLQWRVYRLRLPSIYRWKLVENNNSELRILKILVQKRPENRGSRWLAMLSRISQYFTICFMKRHVASSVVQSVGVAMNVPYLEKRSITTMMDRNSPTFGRAEMKSIEMLSQGWLGTGSGSNNPPSLWYSTLSC